MKREVACERALASSIRERTNKAKSDEQVTEEFGEAVNMSRKELEDWLQTDDSASVLVR